MEEVPEGAEKRLELIEKVWQWPFLFVQNGQKLKLSSFSVVSAGRKLCRHFANPVVVFLFLFSDTVTGARLRGRRGKQQFQPRALCSRRWNLFSGTNCSFRNYFLFYCELNTTNVFARYFSFFDFSFLSLRLFERKQTFDSFVL